MTGQTAATPSYTYGDYLRWTGEERWEIVAGEAFAMSPAPSRSHQEVVGELFRQIANQLGEQGSSCRAYLAPFDVRLPDADEADEMIDTVVQPDLSIICDAKKLDHQGCRGAPDWIIEVLSSSTAVRDQILKRDLYAQHGVQEYWIVHPDDRIVTLYRLTEGSQTYGAPEIFEARGETAAQVLSGLGIRWSLVFP